MSSGHLNWPKEILWTRLSEAEPHWRLRTLLKRKKVLLLLKVLCESGRSDRIVQLLVLKEHWSHLLIRPLVLTKDSRRRIASNWL